MNDFTWGENVVRWQVQGEGPAVVLCHGTPWSMALWDRASERLSRKYSVYRWDMVGFGTSEKRRGQDVSLRAQGRLFAALLEHWRLPSPHVVAHDIGGAVALRGALLHGCAYGSLALVDVVAVAPWGSPFFQLVREHAEVFGRLPANLHEALVREYIAGASHTGLDARQLDVLASPWLGPTGQAAFYRQIAQADQAHTDEIEPRYGELDLPVRIIWGTADSWIPVDRAHALHAAIPQSSLRLLDNAGHLVQFDANGTLLPELEQWLSGVA